MQTFTLENQEYIELNKLLKLLQLTESGGEANEAIVRARVKVNGVIEIQKRKKLRPGDKVQFAGKQCSLPDKPRHEIHISLLLHPFQYSNQCWIQPIGHKRWGAIQEMGLSVFGPRFWAHQFGALYRMFEGNPLAGSQRYFLFTYNRGAFPDSTLRIWGAGDTAPRSGCICYNGWCGNGIAQIVSLLLKIASR